VDSVIFRLGLNCVAPLMDLLSPFKTVPNAAASDISRERNMSRFLLTMLFTIPMLTLSRCNALEFKRELFQNQSEFSKCKEAAFKFATEKRILIQRIERPNVVQVDRVELHRITKLPQLPGKRLHGACDFRGKTIYVCSVLDLDVLRHEYGHWFFGASEEMADAFMDYAREFIR